MNNLPFQFLDSPSATDKLNSALGAVGLQSARFPPDPEGYSRDHNDPRHMRFICPWLPAPVELLWHYSYWPDGEHEELTRVRIVFKGVTAAEIDIGPLLTKPLAEPLVDFIIDQLVSECAALTGRRLPKRGDGRLNQPSDESEGEGHL